MTCFDLWYYLFSSSVHGSEYFHVCNVLGEEGYHNTRCSSFRGLSTPEVMITFIPDSTLTSNKMGVVSYVLSEQVRIVNQDEEDIWYIIIIWTCFMVFFFKEHTLTRPNIIFKKEHNLEKKLGDTSSITCCLYKHNLSATGRARRLFEENVIWFK